MHSRVPRATWRCVLAGAALAFLGLASVGASLPAGPRYWKRGYVHFVESDGYLYSFDAAWRVESLRRCADAPGPAAGTTVVDTGRGERMRRTFLAIAGAPSLDLVPVEGRRELDAMRALGYL